MIGRLALFGPFRLLVIECLVCNLIRQILISKSLTRVALMSALGPLPISWHFQALNYDYYYKNNLPMRSSDVVACFFFSDFCILSDSYFNDEEWLMSWKC